MQPQAKTNAPPPPIRKAAVVLSLPRQRFVAEYIKDFNGSQAAIRAGYSKNHSSVAAAKLLRSPLVRAAIDARVAELAQKHEITQDKVLTGIAKIAYGTVGENGLKYSDQLKALEDLAKFLKLFSGEDEAAKGGNIMVVIQGLDAKLL